MGATVKQLLLELVCLVGHTALQTASLSYNTMPKSAVEPSDTHPASGEFSSAF